jgi:hypothetical protein
MEQLQGLDIQRKYLSAHRTVWCRGLAAFSSLKVNISILDFDYSWSLEDGQEKSVT